MYAGRRREDHNAVNIIAGTFAINAIPYFTLIDTRSTHSYFSCEMADKLGIRVEGTVSDVFVLSPLRQSVHVNKIYK